MDLKNLKMPAEAAGSQVANQTKVRRMFDKFEDQMESVYEGITAVRNGLQSSVLSDMLKQEGFPASESKAAKDAVEAAFQAVKKAFGEIEDLHMALGTHFEQEDNK